MIALPPLRRRTRISLTPMIDVVFLLLIFFMLAARLGPAAVLPLATGSGAPMPTDLPPRLVELRAEGVFLNGVPQARLEDLAQPDAVQPLFAALDTLGGRAAPLALRPAADVSLEALAQLLDRLSQGGAAHVILVSP